MTLDEVKALGGKTLGTLSAIPRDEWEEMSLDRLRQMKAELAVCLVTADRIERRSIVERDRCLSRALEKAEMGERASLRSSGPTSQHSICSHQQARDLSRALEILRDKFRFTDYWGPRLYAALWQSDNHFRNAGAEAALATFTAACR